MTTKKEEERAKSAMGSTGRGIGRGGEEGAWRWWDGGGIGG